MTQWRSWYRQIRAIKWLSPGSFILCAVTFTGVFLALHVLGWRESTRVLSGTLPAERAAQTWESFQAAAYVLFYMAAVIVAPILLLASVVFQGLVLWRKRRSGGSL